MQCCVKIDKYSSVAAYLKEKYIFMAWFYFIDEEISEWNKSGKSSFHLSSLAGVKIKYPEYSSIIYFLLSQWF
jgi:hypothetical protein